MRYKVLGQYFEGKRREVLGRFDFGGNERIKDDRNPDFLKAAKLAANTSNVRDIYAVIPDG